MARLDFLNKGERFILDWIGTIIIAIGGSGLILTLLFDQVARQEVKTTWGWLQILGVIVSIGLVLFGGCVHKYMMVIARILDDWVRK